MDEVDLGRDGIRHAGVARRLLEGQSEVM